MVLPKLIYECARFNDRPGDHATATLLMGFLQLRPPNAVTCLIIKVIINLNEVNYHEIILPLNI